MQEALFEAYRKLDKFEESCPMKACLFRIAHNRSIDLRRRECGTQLRPLSPCQKPRRLPSRLVFIFRQGSRRLTEPPICAKFNMRARKWRR